MNANAALPESTTTRLEPTRRTITTGIAWSIPAVAVASAAPLAAASAPPYVSCVAIPQNVGTWDRTSSDPADLSGCGAQRYVACEDLYVNECDYTGTETGKVRYSSVLSNLEPNTLYQFIFSTKAGAGCPHPGDSRQQGLALEVDGLTIWAGQTAGITNPDGGQNGDLFAGTGVTAVDLDTYGKRADGEYDCPPDCTSSCAAGCTAPVCCASAQQWFVQWCSGDQTSATLAFEFSIAAGGSVEWNDDIAVTTPIVTCIGLCGAPAA